MNTPIKKLPHKSIYYNAVLKNALFALFILLISLAIGIGGYSYFFNLGFVDSLLNASMILTGMGPVDRAETDGAKIFASFYALYSGVAFLSSVAVLFGPVLHRFLHRFHLDVRD
ncbi:MAG: hypothetical protein ACXVP0_09730 [Bacteroidia bacterium]